MRILAVLMGLVALVQGGMAAAGAFPVELEEIVHAPAELVVSRRQWRCFLRPRFAGGVGAAPDGHGHALA